MIGITVQIIGISVQIVGIGVQIVGIGVFFVKIDDLEQLFIFIGIRSTRQPREQEALAEYGAWLAEECRRALSIVLPFTDAECAFLDLLLERGEIDASILTSDVSLQQRIQAQPLLEWKALNVRRHEGLP